MWYTSLLENNKVPDFLIRKGIRNLLQQRLNEEKKATPDLQQEHLME
ncbi:MAG: SAM-dependent methyltransferase, partial [Flavobacteriia bacterium]|nr:SAM-dependent methyltransferase [Flavobacteriia bacterium]